MKPVLGWNTTISGRGAPGGAAGEQRARHVGRDWLPSHSPRIRGSLFSRHLCASYARSVCAFGALAVPAGSSCVRKRRWRVQWAPCKPAPLGLWISPAYPANEIERGPDAVHSVGECRSRKMTHEEQRELQVLQTLRCHPYWVNSTVS